MPATAHVHAAAGAERDDAPAVAARRSRRWPTRPTPRAGCRPLPRAARDWRLSMAAHRTRHPRRRRRRPGVGRRSVPRRRSTASRRRTRRSTRFNCSSPTNARSSAARSQSTRAAPPARPSGRWPACRSPSRTTSACAACGPPRRRRFSSTYVPPYDATVVRAARGRRRRDRRQDELRRVRDGLVERELGVRPRAQSVGARRARRADRAAVRRPPWPRRWSRSRSAPTPAAPSASRRRSAASSG